MSPLSGEDNTQFSMNEGQTTSNLNQKKNAIKTDLQQRREELIQTQSIIGQELRERAELILNKVIGDVVDELRSSMERKI